MTGHAIMAHGASDRAQIEDLVGQFAWLIDHRAGHGVAALFTRDGRYALRDGSFDLRGRDDIEDFYERRRATGPRTSRHLFSNIRIQPIDHERAYGTCVLTLHAADGTPPHPMEIVMVADYHDSYRRAEDGEWQFEKRVVTPLFGHAPHVGVGE